MGMCADIFARKNVHVHYEWKSIAEQQSKKLRLYTYIGNSFGLLESDLFWLVSVSGR